MSENQTIQCPKCANHKIFINELGKETYLFQILQSDTAINCSLIQNQYLSFFKKIALLQYYIFNQEKVNYAVIEAVIGGRLDVTNINSKNKICILNNIGFGHTQWLGNTLDKIFKALESISNRDNWKININAVKNKFLNINFAGRFEIIKTNSDQIIIIDGTHNEQKMDAFLTSLFELYKTGKFLFRLARK